MARKMNQLAVDIDFVLGVGDNFYDYGVKSVDDPIWDNNWRNIF